MVCTSQTGVRCCQAHSGTGRVQCPARRILADHGAHVDWCVISAQGLVKEAHQVVADSLVDRQPAQHLQCWRDMVTLVQTHHHVGSIVSGQLQSPECCSRLAYQQRVTVVHPGHHPGQHSLDTGIPVQEASDVADGVQVMEHGAIDNLDLARHVHGEVHDDAEVVEGGHCMHSDATNAHSWLQCSVGGLVVRSCDDHELRLIAVDLKLVDEQPDPDLLYTHLQLLQCMPVAAHIS